MAGPFVDRYRAIVKPLFGGMFTDADGLVLSDQGRSGYELPEALRDFYAVVGGFDPVMSAHNHFYLPGGFDRVDGKLIFCDENQVVVRWGYDEDQGWRADPPVYQGVNNDEIEWYLEADRCSDFLTGMIYWQALGGGLPEAGFRFGVDEAVRQAAAAWPLVWRDEDSQVYSRGPVVFAITQTKGGIDVEAAGLSEAELEAVWSSLGLGSSPP